GRECFLDVGQAVAAACRLGLQNLHGSCGLILVVERPRYAQNPCGFSGAGITPEGGRKSLQEVFRMCGIPAKINRLLEKPIGVPTPSRADDDARRRKCLASPPP